MAPKEGLYKADWPEVICGTCAPVCVCVMSEELRPSLVFLLLTFPNALFTKVEKMGISRRFILHL